MNEEEILKKYNAEYEAYRNADDKKRAESIKERNEALKFTKFDFIAKKANDDARFSVYYCGMIAYVEDRYTVWVVALAFPEKPTRFLIHEPILLSGEISVRIKKLEDIMAEKSWKK